MKFIADTMLGRLARWLRICGYDVVYSNTATDDEILRIALKEKRYLLTRDNLLYWRAGKWGALVPSSDIKEQLTWVEQHFSCKLEVKYTRCPVCNEQVVPVKLEDVEEKIPPKVKQFAKEFWMCPKCKRIYWEGSHRQKAELFLKKAKNKEKKK